LATLERVRKRAVHMASCRGSSIDWLKRGPSMTQREGRLLGLKVDGSHENGQRKER